MLYNWFMREFDDLVDVIKKLRGKNGCPWDKKQTHRSLKPYMIEEAYETVHAIDGKDDNKLKDELGDVLLQVVLHSQIAKEKGRFSIDDVVRAITEKMVRRHPHVFSKKKRRSVSQVWKNWEEIKSAEGRSNSILDSIPNAMPALYRADKAQKKAARVGFDWDSVAGAWEKVFEELEEVKELLTGPRINKNRVSEEMGDLLFSIVNVARKLDLNSEELLQSATDKFSKRFRYIEAYCRKKKLKISSLSLEKMEQLWREAKSKRRLFAGPK